MIIHTVARGETLFSIARRYNVSIQAIITLNNITDPNLIFVGQQLRIPTTGMTQIYTVLPGDTAFIIAQKFRTTVARIVQLNNLTNPDLIFVGQRLTVPALPTDVIFQGNPAKNLIALTFDATFGDNQTESILNILRINGIRATFFLAGIWVRDFPNLARLIVSSGMEVGNHSWDHPHMTQLTESQIRQQLIQANGEIIRTTGIIPKYFRPPFGEFNNTIVTIASALGYRTVMWTVDSLDWQNPPPEQIVNRVVQNARNGAIVLMHNAGRNTPAALQPMITQLRQRGFGFGTVSEVLDP